MILLLVSDFGYCKKRTKCCILSRTRKSVKTNITVHMTIFCREHNHFGHFARTSPLEDRQRTLAAALQIASNAADVQ